MQLSRTGGTKCAQPSTWEGTKNKTQNAKTHTSTNNKNTQKKTAPTKCQKNKSTKTNGTSVQLCALCVALRRAGVLPRNNGHGKSLVFPRVSRVYTTPIHIYVYLLHLLQHCMLRIYILKLKKRIYLVPRTPQAACYPKQGRSWTS